MKDHGLDLDDAKGCDWDHALIVPSYPGKRGEARFKAVVRFGDDLVVVVLSALGTEAVSVISMRRASRKERNLYAQR